MNDALKIMIGAGATALLAWGVHGPMGRGQAFIAGLQAQARAALAMGGLDGVHVDYPDNPYSRTASLSGKVDLMDQGDAISILRALNGSAGAVWRDKGAVAARAVETASTSDAAQNGAAPAKVATEAAKPTAQPSPTPASRAIPTSTSTSAPTPAPSAPLAAHACQRTVDAALAGRVMSFRSGSAWLNPQSTKMIADVAAALKGCRGYAIEIGGHTDGTGNESVNRAMSQERANRVREALVARGVAAGAVTAKGFGSGRPLRAGNTLDPANRRISFTVTGGGA